MVDYVIYGRRRLSCNCVWGCIEVINNDDSWRVEVLKEGERRRRRRRRRRRKR